MNMTSVIEKVILLQNVDLFSEVPTEQLAYPAAIAESRRFDADDVIYRQDDPSDAMYLVLSGRVRLSRDGTEVTTAVPLQAFGTWALFDDEPRVATAVALQTTEVLRIDRQDFVDVLADNVRVTQSILRTVSRRLRALGRVVRGPAEAS
jgi:CRP/FNR family transcriptional regulator, cyclic AMP receptor protein